MAPSHTLASLRHVACCALFNCGRESPREAGFDLQSKMLRGMRELSGVSALAPRSRIQAYPLTPLRELLMLVVGDLSSQITDWCPLFSLVTTHVLLGLIQRYLGCTGAPGSHAGLGT